MTLHLTMHMHNAVHPVSVTKCILKHLSAKLALGTANIFCWIQHSTCEWISKNNSLYKCVRNSLVTAQTTNKQQCWLLTWRRIRLENNTTSRWPNKKIHLRNAGQNRHYIYKMNSSMRNPRFWNYMCKCNRSIEQSHEKVTKSQSKKYAKSSRTWTKLLGVSTGLRVRSRCSKICITLAVKLGTRMQYAHTLTHSEMRYVTYVGCARKNAMNKLFDWFATTTRQESLLRQGIYLCMLYTGMPACHGYGGTQQSHCIQVQIIGILYRDKRCVCRKVEYIFSWLFLM